MTKKRADLKVNTSAATVNNVTPAQEPIGLDEYQQHLERLRGVSAIAAKLFALLGEQITAVSSTAPIQRGHKTVEELKVQARAHRDGLATAFDPLREQIESLKNDFCEKNRGVVEAMIKEYVQRKVEERVTVEVENAIKNYRVHLGNNEQNNKKLKAIVNASRARAQNSLLRSKYPEEQVTWIDGEDPMISFGELASADESRSESLAKSLDLTPGEEDTRISTLNKIFRKLGIQYRVIPSWTGTLLMPNMTNIG